MDTLLEECEDYDIDKDVEVVEENSPGGDYGVSLASRVYRRYETLSLKKAAEEREEQAKRNLWREIAFRKFPPLLPGETILVGEIRERFRGLKKAGYDIKLGYSRLNKKASFGYFRKIRKDISSLFR